MSIKNINCNGVGARMELEAEDDRKEASNDCDRLQDELDNALFFLGQKDAARGKALADYKRLQKRSINN